MGSGCEREQHGGWPWTAAAAVTVLPSPGAPWVPRLQRLSSGPDPLALHGTGLGGEWGLGTGKGTERRGGTQAQQVLPEDPRPWARWGREAAGRDGEPWTGSRYVYSTPSSLITARSFHMRVGSRPDVGAHGDQTTADGKR